MSKVDLSSIPPEQLEDFINNGGIHEVASSLIKEVVPEVKEEPPTAPSIPPDFEGLDIKDPVELLFLLDEDIASGRVKLYPWQVQILVDFATGGVSSDKALHQVVRACNGSGKDKYVIAPCCVWMTLRYKHSRCVVTSASGQQLDSQTGTYITQLCEAANRKFSEVFGCPAFKINYRYYECLLTGSPIDMFATDEPKKAEGYHPFRDGSKMGIFVSEDKTVPDVINGALSRCTGYTHRLHVSTPGEPAGHFYDYCTMATQREDIKSVLDLGPIDWVEYHVTAFECGHLGKNHADKTERESPGGKEGAYYKSVIMAEFGTTDSMVVIPNIYVQKAIKGACGWKQKPYFHAGLDLADGGDETVLVIRNGNRMMHMIPFRFDNTEDTVKFLDEKFREYHLNHPESRIRADCIGLGKPILDRLVGMGWTNIVYIDSRHKAKNPRVYKNFNSEMWFEFRKLCERGEIWLMDDLKLKKQLATRYYKITGGIHQLESKIDARAKGHTSPDRADATVLAFIDYETTFTAPEVKRPFDVAEEKERNPVSGFQQRLYLKEQPEQRYTRTPNKGKDFSLLRDLISEHNKLQRSIESN